VPWWHRPVFTWVDVAVEGDGLAGRGDRSYGAIVEGRSPIRRLAAPLSAVSLRGRPPDSPVSGNAGYGQNLRLVSRCSDTGP
jgi:hypothetical protein